MFGTIWPDCSAERNFCLVMNIAKLVFMECKQYPARSPWDGRIVLNGRLSVAARCRILSAEEKRAKRKSCNSQLKSWKKGLIDSMCVGGLCVQGFVWTLDITHVTDMSVKCLSKASFLFTFYFGMKLCRVHVGSLSVQVQKLGVLVLWDLFKFRKRGGRKVQLVAVETRKPIGRTLMCSTPTPFICTGKQLANALLFAAQNMLTVVATGTRLRV